MYQRILVAVDGSAPSNRALGEAVRLAGDQGAVLRIAHVVDYGVLLAAWGDAALLDLKSLEDALRATGVAILESAVADTRATTVATETVLLETDSSDPARAILAEAERWGADVIAIGTHGRRGLRRLLLGSVAEGVVRASPVPVLLLRGARDGQETF